MATLQTHFRNILYSNFDPYREPLKVKFTQVSSDRKVLPFTVQYLDGFCKGLICQAIVGLVDYLAAWHFQFGAACFEGMAVGRLGL